MHDACIEACSSAASLFGPLGELAIWIIGCVLVVWSRFQVRRERGAAKVAKTEAQALRTAIVSLRPDAMPTIEQALRAPSVPIIDTSNPEAEDRETKP